MVTCPSCDAAIDVEEEELDEGDVVTCEDCGAEFRVIGLDPLEMEPFEEEEEEDLDSDDEDEAEASWR